MSCIQVMFDPKIMALIGVTEKEGAVGRTILENLLRSKERRIFPINPHTKKVLDVKHPHHYVQLYLSYLQKKNHKITGREKGRAFQDGIEAWIYLREIQTAIEEKEFIPWNYRARTGSITLFENFFNRFKSKYSNYRRYFGQLLNMDLGSIDRIVVKKFCRNLPEKLSQSSKNLILQILRAALSEAYQEGIIDFIPAFPRRERAKEPVKNALTWSEQMAVIQAMPKKYQLIFLFLACHGKRISEALSLKWEDIDFKTKSFRIYESKVKKESRLPLHEEFFNTLPFAGAINKTGPFFPVCSDDSLNRVLKTACAKAGVKKVTTHEFGRHSFVSQLLPHFTKEQVALITNNLSSVSRYAHMDLEQKRRIINSNRSLT